MASATAASASKVEEQGPIVPDTTSSTSDYEETLQTETTSLHSSIFNFEFENGRRYHRTDSKSLLPNDEREQDRLDLYHELMYLLLDERLTLAPLSNPHRVLDVGTGTGIWALDMAAEYPSAEVIGTDITPIQPRWVLPNCRFEIDDLENDWTFPRNHFDLVHSRNLAQAVRSWPEYLQKIKSVLVPGGYVELLESRTTGVATDDDSLPPDASINEYFRLITEGCKKLGINLPIGEDFVQLLQDAGFTEISLSSKKQPWAPWPADKKMKQAGRLGLAVAETGLSAYGLGLMTRVLGMSPEEAQEVLDKTWAEVRNRKYHIYNYLDVVVARKPGA